MEKSQSEVTDKIRHSIKEKLKEMNTFVDDELPDYIMILIANKRSKHHMEKDLSLFLGNQTVTFTNWLWDLVNAFKGGAKVQNPKTNPVSDSQLAENFQSKETRLEEDDVLNYDPAEQGESLCLEEINEPSNNVLTVISEKISDPKIPLLNEDELSQNSHLLQNIAVKPQPNINIVQERNKASSAQGELSKTSPNKQKSAKVYPMQRIKQFPKQESIALKSASVVSKPEYSGVASVVCFTQKKFGGATAALQANKLLLRAVNDATKSVLSGRDINDYYKPTPIKELAESKKNKEELNEIIHTKSNSVSGLIKKPLEARIINYEIQEPILESVQNLEQVTSRHIVDLKSEEDIFEEPENISSNVPQVQSEELAASPHFIVTLDGVDFTSLKRKRSIIADDEPMDIDDDDEEFDDEIVEQVKDKKQKITERCKYWPACKNNTDCAYHHPTISCKTFPNCKFGDKCLYIHPNCKFDALCSKRSCPFTHCSERKYNIAPAAVVKPQKVQKSKIVCKYYPRCTAVPCPYIHPKLCKFGTQCRAPKCSFGHFQIPNRNQLKWKAI